VSPLFTGVGVAPVTLADVDPERRPAALADDAEAPRALRPAHVESLRDFPVGIKGLARARFGRSDSVRVGS
jgi:hypothetical protein